LQTLWIRYYNEYKDQEKGIYRVAIPSFRAASKADVGYWSKPDLCEALETLLARRH
jgi:hypothetical protein